MAGSSKERGYFQEAGHQWSPHYPDNIHVKCVCVLAKDISIITLWIERMCPHAHTDRGAEPRKDALAHIYVSLCLTKGSISNPLPTPPHPSHTHTHPSNAKSHNGISDGKNVLSSDDGQIDGEYSQMSEMINGRVLRQDHTHTHTQQYSLLHLYSHMQIHTQTAVSSTAEGCITVQDEIRQTFL